MRTQLWWLVLLLSILWGAPLRAAPLRAAEGVLDLRAADLSAPVALDGDWQFWWGALHTPVSLGGAGEPLLLDVPQDWTDQGTATVPISSAGYGTYRLRVLLPDVHPALGLEVGRITTASRLYLNGTLAAEAGEVGAREGDSLPRMKRQLVAVPANTGSLELLVQVSNFHHRAGGLRQHWTLGSWPAQSARVQREVAAHGMSVTLLLVSGALFFAMFLAHRRDHARLWFAVLCALVGVRVATGGNADVVLLLLPDLSTPWLLRLEYSSTFLIFTVSMILVQSMFPRQAPPLLIRTLLASSLLFAVASVLGGPVLVTGFKGPLLALAAVTMSAFIGVVVRARAAGVPMATPLLAAGLVFACTSVYDALLGANVLAGSVELMPLGFAGILVVEAVVLIKQYADAFKEIDTLSKDLQQAHDTLTQTHEAVIRFVPFEFLRLLGKASIRDIHRGDHAQLDVSVMFCDIRGFTTIIEGLSPEEAFGFINRWLAIMEPEIYGHGGFIKEYLGDCIVAVFPTDTDEALGACVAMQRALEDFPVDQDPTGRLQVGFGLHTGQLIMGTIGGGERLDTGTVGDVVNTSARLESMTRIYGVRMLVSGAVVGALCRPERFTLREVDQVRAKGKRTAVRIFEVLDCCAAADRDARLATAGPFQAGLRAYRQGEPAAARAHFAAVAAQDPADTVAALYLQRCDEQLRGGVPAGWDGVTDLRRK